MVPNSKKRKLNQTLCFFTKRSNKDVIQKIMICLSCTDLVLFNSTCKLMSEFGKAENVWFHLLQRDFNVDKDPVFDSELSYLQIYKQEKLFLDLINTEFFLHELKNDNEYRLAFSSSKNDVDGTKCCLRRLKQIDNETSYSDPPCF